MMEKVSYDLIFAGIIGAFFARAFEEGAKYLFLRRDERKQRVQDAVKLATGLELFALKCIDAYSGHIDTQFYKVNKAPKLPDRLDNLDLSLIDEKVSSEFLSLRVYCESAQSTFDDQDIYDAMKKGGRDKVVQQLLIVAQISLSVAAECRRSAGLPKLLIPQGVWDYPKYLRDTLKEISEKGR